MSRQLPPEDFREMKAEYTTKLEKLEAKLSATENDNVSIDHLLDKSVKNLFGFGHDLRRRRYREEA